MNNKNPWHQSYRIQRIVKIVATPNQGLLQFVIASVDETSANVVGKFEYILKNIEKDTRLSRFQTLKSNGSYV